MVSYHPLAQAGDLRGREGEQLVPRLRADQRQSRGRGPILRQQTGSSLPRSPCCLVPLQQFFLLKAGAGPLVSDTLGFGSRCRG